MKVRKFECSKVAPKDLCPEGTEDQEDSSGGTRNVGMLEGWNVERSGSPSRRGIGQCRRRACVQAPRGEAEGKIALRAARKFFWKGRRLVFYAWESDFSCI